MDDLFSLLDAEEYTTDPEWQQVVQNGAQPELSGILKRVRVCSRNIKRELSSAITNVTFVFCRVSTTYN